MMNKKFTRTPLSGKLKISLREYMLHRPRFDYPSCYFTTKVRYRLEDNIGWKIYGIVHFIKLLIVYNGAVDVRVSGEVGDHVRYGIYSSSIAKTQYTICDYVGIKQIGKDNE